MYYWKIEKTEKNIFKDPKPLQEQIADYVATIREFMTNFDNFILRMSIPEVKISPEMAKARFESIQKEGIKYLPETKV